MSAIFNAFYLKFLSVLLFLLVTLNPVFSGNMYNNVHILVGVESEEQGVETKMDNLIFNLLVFELERYGIITEKIQFMENKSFELILSSESDSGLAVICSYTAIGTRVLLDLELYSTRTMLVIASATASADLDLAFDEVISSLVSELIINADEELTKRVLSIDDKILLIESEDDSTSKKSESEISVIKTGVKGGLELDLNIGATMGVGASSDYMQDPGLSLGISTNYWFPATIGYLGIGIHASANHYPGIGQDELTSLLLFPIGISMAWSSPVEKLISGIFRIGGGPSVAVLLFEGADPLTKVIPFFNSALSLSFNFRRWMSLGVKTDYCIYFEDMEMLTTITPSIYVSLRSPK